LRDNKPYDQFVRELVNPRPEAEGFTKGIVWRGVVNASMTPPMQAAQNVSQVFMGVNLKCASCHDSFIDDWQLSDCYGLAGIYADAALPMVQCDKPTGKVAPLRFLFPELGSVDASAPRSNRLEQVARIITQPSNGRLSRTIVNRLWARMMGRGLVEPLDVMQNAAWDADLLDWLAEDLVAHGWDLKRTLRLIATSRAYALPSVDESPKAGEKFVFKGPALRRLTAEQFRDTLGAVTGEWFDRPEGDLSPLLVEPAARDASVGKPKVPDAFWLWGSAHGAGRGGALGARGGGVARARGQLGQGVPEREARARIGRGRLVAGGRVFPEGRLAGGDERHRDRGDQRRRRREPGGRAGLRADSDGVGWWQGIGAQGRQGRVEWERP
jgi:hypothetical protein